MAITRPVYEILNEGADALDALARRLSADPPGTAAAIPGTENDGEEGDAVGDGDGGAAAAAGEGGKGDVEVGPETPWVRELFEAFMRVGTTCKLHRPPPWVFQSINQSPHAPALRTNCNQ